MKAIRLATFEFRRQRLPLQRLVVASLLLVPLLYGGLYLWANWDPYGRTERIPAAVVNDDRPVEVRGGTISAGERLTAALRRTGTFDWHVTGTRDARAGLSEGRYYLVLTVPPDFSADMTSGADPVPARARVDMRVDDANGYLAGIIARTAQDEISRQVDQAATAAYFEAVYGELERFRTQLGDARDAARRLRDGVAAEQEGTAGLVDTLDGLQDDSGRAAGSAGQVAQISRQLADESAPAMRRLSEGLPGVADNAAAVTESSTALVELVNGGADALAGRQRGVEEAVAQLGRERPGLRDDPAYQRLRERSSRMTDRVEAVSRASTRMNADARQLAGSTETLTAGTPDLRGSLGRGVADIERLGAAAERLAADTTRIDGALGEALAGARQTHSAVNGWHAGLIDLASTLSEATNRLPELSPQQRQQGAAALGSPTRVAFTADNPATVYGRGLAPFFFAAALWVFGTVAFLALRPINGRLLAGRAGNLTMALAGWLPVFCVGALGGLAFLGVSELGFGFGAVHPAWAAGLVVLAAASFTAITHLLRILFGPVGSILALVALIVQLAASGGVYPAETLPSFLRVLHPYVPMTYAVDGLRVTMTGGDLDTLVRAAVVLAGCAVLALVATTAVVAWRRVWTPGRLHPVLAVLARPQPGTGVRR